MSGKRFRVFISSTYEDLKDERSKVISHVLNMGHVPIGMEMFSGDSQEGRWTQMKKSIDDADYYVLIIKGRYGSLAPGKKISWTEKEYRYATDKKIPILVFIAADSVVSRNDIDYDNVAKFNDFKKLVKNNRHVECWCDPNELCSRVGIALNNAIRDNKRPGLVVSDKPDDFGFEDMDDELILKIREKVNDERINRRGREEIKNLVTCTIERMDYGINKQIFIEKFSREVTLEARACSKLKVTIGTFVDFWNPECELVQCYCPNPKFETREQANTYKHEEFIVNGTDYCNEIRTRIEEDTKKQMPFKCKNTFPSLRAKDFKIFHKTVHIVPISQFLHDYTLVFPCKSFQATFSFEGCDDYKLKTCSYSSFNGHINRGQTPELRDTKIIDLGDWSLPGSGYVVFMQSVN